MSISPLKVPMKNFIMYMEHENGTALEENAFICNTLNESNREQTLL